MTRARPRLSRRTVLGATAGALAAIGGAAAAPPVKIAMIGAGRMGAPLGSLWIKAGHAVMFSSRHPDELKSMVDRLGPQAHAGTVAEAVAFGDVIVLAIPYGAMPELAAAHGKALAQKALVIDVGNPFPQRDGQPGVDAREKGAGLYVAGLMPGARIVRAFNAISYARLEELARRTEDKIGVPIAGDDTKALALAADLIREIGFEPVLIGSLAAGRDLVPGTRFAGEHSAAELRALVGPK